MDKRCSLFFDNLPTVEVNKLSYIEQLCDFENKLLELEKKISGFNTGTDELKQEINDNKQEITDNKNDILVLNELINNKYLKLDNKIELLERKIGLELQQFQKFIAENNLLVNEIVKQALNKFYVEIKDIPLPTVWSIFSNTYVTVQEYFEQMYKYLAPFPITVKEFDEKRIDVSYFDDLEINSLEFDLRASKILDTGVNNPFTGKFDKVQTVVDELITYVKSNNGAISPQIFDSLKLTVEDIEKLQLNCQEFDFAAQKFL